MRSLAKLVPVACVLLAGCAGIDVLDPDIVPEERGFSNGQEEGGSPDADAEGEAEREPGVEDASAPLEVHFIDVGQGDATLLVHDTTAVLVDTGRHQSDEVVRYVLSLGLDALDLVIITHPHADHIGQFDRLVDAVSITETWWSGATTTTQVFERAVDALERSGAFYEEPRSGDAAEFGRLLLEVVNPPAGTALTDLHDSGLAVRVTFGEARVLFTGDIEAATEDRMVRRNATLLDADLLQLGHHGSSTSTSEAFLAAVDPRIAVYSAGAGNAYGHPDAEVLDRLVDAGVEVYGTAGNGTIVATTDGQDWTVVTEREGVP